MGKEDLVKHIDVEFDQETLGIVINAFTYMINTPDTVDLSMGGLSSLGQLENLTDKLKTFRDSGGDSVNVPMDQGDWTVYEPYIEYACSVVPNPEDRYVLEDLRDYYEGLDNRGMTPC